MRPPPRCEAAWNSGKGLRGPPGGLPLACGQLSKLCVCAQAPTPDGACSATGRDALAPRAGPAPPVAWLQNWAALAARRRTRALRPPIRPARCTSPTARCATSRCAQAACRQLHAAECLTREACCSAARCGCRVTAFFGRGSNVCRCGVPCWRGPGGVTAIGCGAQAANQGIHRQAVGGALALARSCDARRRARCCALRRPRRTATAPSRWS